VVYGREISAKRGRLGIISILREYYKRNVPHLAESELATMVPTHEMES